VAAFAALSRYDNSRSFPVWLSRIAINKAHDWNRRKTVRRIFSFGLAQSQAGHVPDPAPLQDQVIASESELLEVTKAIATLPGPLKEVLLLRTVEAKSEAETAEILGISRKAVENRLHRARERLAKIFPQG
jgi:RNA polymerase sigma-70 factor (ECF subfamily)